MNAADLRATIRYTWKRRHDPIARQYVRWCIRELRLTRESARLHKAGQYSQVRS